eukprot:CAMPEP_0197538620 /NCGR_PEP_ID=MMETSP1318-20131121/60169_1 /TAXON_ID=552666 /ORGANISM="Partenskyella glossopodia, Strain RCC365" /LENGTH=462 /DNA_ID=CAMNT_0043097091 /DNA_START=29 /DNA_END=1417 /DNA_ORIENTATION=-
MALSVILGLTALLLNIRFFRRKQAFAFFHPYAECGGGGERVLFLCIRALQELDPTLPIIVYTGCNNMTDHEIVTDAARRFNTTLPNPKRIRFVRLRLRFLLEASMYPRLTMIGQSLGSVILAFEALLYAPPAVFFDSTGLAFSYPLAWIAGCKVACYTHYPTISTDMISLVQSGKTQFNNSGLVSKVPILRLCKLYYYKAFAFVYGFVGRFSQLTLVNSSWTYNHILNLWKNASTTHVLFPPCDTRHLQTIPLQPPGKKKGGRENLIISLGQFRPEKNHKLQLLAFDAFLKKADAEGLNVSSTKLVIIGGCRNPGDYRRVSELKRLTEELGIQSRVEFCVNLPFDQLLGYLARASLGLHTMRDEHFGICVVEFMAAGVIPVAHDSAGPKLDIVVDFKGERLTGYLATTAEEYAERLLEGLVRIGVEEARSIRERARARADEFSNENFLLAFKRHVRTILASQ